MRLPPPAKGRKTARIWTDLQLPLYRRALLAGFGPGITCGYLNLPKAVGDSALELWEDLGADLQAAADRCADGVAAAVLAGRFWPPTEKPAYDDWEGFFHEGVAASIDPGWARRLQESIASR
jgi:ATP-dependent helicase/nuclease subunit B